MRALQQSHPLPPRFPQALQLSCSTHISEPAARSLAESVSRGVARLEVSRAGERDEMRWRVWMEQYASGQQQAVGREEMQSALAACGMQVR